MRSTFAQFCKQYGTFALTRIALNIPMQHCNHYCYYLQDYIPIPLTLSLTYILHGASTVSSQMLIVSPSLQASYPIPWERKTVSCTSHKITV